METKSPDIRIVNLYRKAIHVPERMETGNKDLWLATDYFDAFEVQKIDLERLRFGLIEAINAKLPTMNDVATQSFPLVYEEDDKPEGLPCDAWGEPFDEIKDDYPFLSLIQTYITPEAFARNDINVECQDGIYELTRRYYEDIYTIVSDFYNKNSDCEFKFKIYRSLSVGDFAVVICSKKADIPYCISTAMRRRRAILHGQGSDLADAKDIVIYKTYTILSMHNSWIQDDLVTGAANSHFILRCCYSNKYWSSRSRSDEELKKYEEALSDRLNRLTGRYDFSVNLSDLRFGHIFKDLQKYKLGIPEEGEETKKFHNHTEEGYDEADYLHYLITKEYLSHINERFSFSFSERGTLVPSESGIFLHDEKASLDYTDRKNQEYLTTVKEKCKETINEVKKIPGYHKNLDNNMRLLSRLIDMCGTLNGLSDMRIYCTLVLKYLQVLLSNLNHYCVGIVKNERYELVPYMDSALGSIIFILNAFIDYVRNNNLQSLQTPNYNIESNLSLEKYLIGYSGFIEELLNHYIQAFDFLKPEWNEHGGTQNLEPVVVPQAENEVLTVQILFPRFDHSDKADVKRLMVVKCPTFNELTNIAEMTATLIHETAHRFRYEPRKQRNSVIARYIARRAFDGTAKGIMTEIQREFPYLPLLERSYLALNDEMGNAYLKSFYPELLTNTSKDELFLKGQSVCEYPIRLLGQRMQDDYRAFIEADKYFDEFDIKLRRFIDTASVFMDFSDENTQIAFHKLVVFKEEYLAKGDRDEAISAEVFLALFKDTEMAIKNLCPQFDKDKYGEISIKEDEKEAFIAFNVLLDCLTDMKKRKNHYYNARVINRKKYFYNTLYNSICDKVCLPKAEEKEGKIEMEMEVARYLCVDFKSEGNRKVFTEIVEDKIQSMLEPSIDLARRSVYAYRELTADLFMVNLLGLDPFGYLLISARNLPMGKEPLKLHLRRVANVLYIFFMCQKEETEYKSLKEEWADNIERLWTKVQSIISKMLVHYISELSSFDKSFNTQEIEARIGEYLKDMKTCLDGKSSMEVLDIFLETMNNIRDILEEDYLSDTAEYLRHMLLEITTYCNVLKYIKFLSIHGLRHIEELRAYDFLEDDLISGFREISRMKEVIDNGSLAKHFQVVKEYYNSPYVEPSDSQNSFEMLSFILRMFYEKKIQTAGDIIIYESGQ